MFHSFGTVQSNAGVPGGDFVDLDGNVAGDTPQRLAGALSGDASANRVQLLDEPVHPKAGIGKEWNRPLGGDVIQLPNFPRSKSG